jgi:hypothetical protein
MRRGGEEILAPGPAEECQDRRVHLATGQNFSNKEYNEKLTTNRKLFQN